MNDLPSVARVYFAYFRFDDTLAIRAVYLDRLVAQSRKWSNHVRTSFRDGLDGSSVYFLVLLLIGHTRQCLGVSRRSETGRRVES